MSNISENRPPHDSYAEKTAILNLLLIQDIKQGLVILMIKNSAKKLLPMLDMLNLNLWKN